MMKCVICQCRFELGNILSNQKKILSLARRYKTYDLILFPEMALMGYPPEDLLEQKQLVQAQQKIFTKIQTKIDNQALLFGACVFEKKLLFNSAVYINRKNIQFFHKSFLALSDTFDEMRFFSPGTFDHKILSIKNKKVFILICEDLWKIKKIPKQKKIDLIICLNASPFFPEQIANRQKISKNLCQKLNAPLIYVNLIGGQDEWIFDGSSFILNQKGDPIVQCPSFKEHIQTIDIDQIKNLKKNKRRHSALFLKKSAIQLGIYDFISKNKIKKVHLGLSGGLDSAVTACLCVEALGAQNVTSFFLKGPYTLSISRKFSLKLAQELDIQWIEQSIIAFYKSFLCQKLSPLAKENIQARIRTLFLMAYSNTHSSFLIGTSNKSELAMGYGTLYGDLSGAFFPIGDLYKTEIQQMAKKFYFSSTIKQILQRPPSAELSIGQKDQDDLPPYKTLDRILKNIIEKTKKPKTKLEKKIFSQILQTEFKRRQSPFVLKVSSKAFGRGRRYPITLHL